MHKEKGNLKNEKTLRKLWDIIKGPNIYETGIPEGEEGEGGGEQKKYLKK